MTKNIDRLDMHLNDIYLTAIDMLPTGRAGQLRVACCNDNVSRYFGRRFDIKTSQARPHSARHVTV